MENYCQTVPITVSFFPPLPALTTATLTDDFHSVIDVQAVSLSPQAIAAIHSLTLFFSKSMGIKTWMHSLSTWFMLFDVSIFTSHFTEVVIVWSFLRWIWPCGTSCYCLKKERTVKLKGQRFTFTGQQNNRRRMRLSRQAVNIDHCCRLVW